MSKNQLENLWREAVKEGFTPEIKKQIAEYPEYGKASELISFLSDCMDKQRQEKISSKEMNIAASLAGKIETAVKKLISEKEKHPYLDLSNVKNND